MKNLLLFTAFTFFCLFVNGQNSTNPLTEEEPIHLVPEQMPEFPGGFKALADTIRKNLRWPNLDGWQGTVLVKFAVMKDGSVDRVTVQHSLHPLYDEEAVRVVKSLPKWIPAKINGKPVNCYFTVPVVFVLQ
jgi:TonB family protein